jgi:hypothetical protein
MIAVHTRGGKGAAPLRVGARRLWGRLFHREQETIAKVRLTLPPGSQEFTA